MSLAGINQFPSPGSPDVIALVPLPQQHWQASQRDLPILLSAPA